MSILKLKTTRIFQQIQDSKARIVANEGGSRSSKTYSLAQFILLLMLTKEDVVIDICRKTLPALKATVLKDFLNVLEQSGYYQRNNFNKSELVYRHTNGAEVAFYSLDDEQKVRGRKRDYCWLNETNEFKYEDFKQFIIRTKEKMFLDYNPSDTESWIYDFVHTRKDVEIIRSTYLDNPFLEQSLIDEIEHYKEVDENFWRIYGLGLRGLSVAKIFSNWDYCDDLPKSGERIFGLDFGYNNETALVEVVNHDNNYYLKERLYRSRLTNQDLIDLLETMQIEKEICIYADTEDTNRIEELKRAGFWVEGAYKGKGSVKDGIDFMKRHKIYLTKCSVNGAKEFKSYSWKRKNDEQLLDEPVKINDHFCDASRYAIYTHFGNVRPEPRVREV